MKPIARYVLASWRCCARERPATPGRRCAPRPLAEVSAAIIPANGFPLYYVDANGLALPPCPTWQAAGRWQAPFPTRWRRSPSRPFPAGVLLCPGVAS